MKKIVLLFCSVFLAVAMQGQAPAQINYQGVARAANGNVLADQNIRLRLSVRSGSANGSIVYQETRGVRTNRYGMFVIAIGSEDASSVIGSLASVDWSTGGDKFLQVEMDGSNGTNFSDMGTTQLLSVPYALHAGRALPSGTAGGHLTGAYPNPSIAPGVVTETALADGAVGPQKIADGSISANKIADSSITAAKLAPGVMGTISGAAGGDLAGNYPDPAIAAGAVDSNKLASAAVTTSKIRDGSITAAKLAPGLVPGGSTPTGTAGGDLTGIYPNPTIAANAITTGKIANGAILNAKLADGVVSNSKIADGAVTISKLAAGVLPLTLPPSGTAGGDLGGTYPSPLVVKLRGTAISNTAPAAGQVLKFDGSQWTPANESGGSGSFSLPYNASAAFATPVFSIDNSGTGVAIEGIHSASGTNGFGLLGKITAASTGQHAAGVRGINHNGGTEGYGVWGSHEGAGPGVYGSSANGIGLKGFSTAGYGVFAQADNETGIGLFATSSNGIPAFIDIANGNSFYDALFVNNNGYGSGITTIGTMGNGLLAIANDLAGAGVIGMHNAGGEGVVGRTFSNMAAGVVGRNDGAYAGVRGYNVTDNGTGVLAQANVDGAVNGNALVAELQGAGAGNTAVFRANNANVGRIDHTGKAFFNGGTQVGGADVAEYFDVAGSIASYEPGDVLVISQHADRQVAKSAQPYSTLVAGVYATKPGLYLTEHNAEQDRLRHMAPMGVIGVIPTKVCLEGGAIRRGDLLVTSSLAGVAMKADPGKVKVGQVLGKALQDYSGNGVGRINVLVSVK